MTPLTAAKESRPSFPLPPSAVVLWPHVTNAPLSHVNRAPSSLRLQVRTCAASQWSHCARRRRVPRPPLQLPTIIPKSERICPAPPRQREREKSRSAPYAQTQKQCGIRDERRSPPPLSSLLLISYFFSALFFRRRHETFLPSFISAVLPASPVLVSLTKLTQMR